MSMIAAAIGRVFLGLIFVIGGLQMLFRPDAAMAMFQQSNLSPDLAIPVGIFEILAGLALALGLMTRLTSVLLIGFTALSIVFFHNQVTDPVTGQIALHKLAVIGGLFVVFAYGQMRWSYDHIRAARKNEVAVAKARAETHKAEVRAARAEAMADNKATSRTIIRDTDGDGRPEIRKKSHWSFT